MKRPAFRPIEFDGRRKKKRVSGGRIKIVKRTEEYVDVDTYCEVCEIGYRDSNAKALHERSDIHRRNIGYMRREQAEREQNANNVTNIASTVQVSEHVRRENIREGTLALLKSKSLPKDFKEWAERSLIAARKAATESNDPSLLQAVQREIVHVHKYNDENCSLRRVCWTRREPATGSRYRDSSFASSSMPVIKDSEVQNKDKVEVSKTEESYAGQQQPALSFEKVPQKAPAEAVDVHHKVVPIHVVDETPPPAPPIIYQPPLNELQVARPTSTRSTPLPTPNLPPYSEVKLKWRLSKGAQAMLSCCRTEYKEEVLANYNNRFGNEIKRDEDPVKEQADVNPKESLIATYREVREQIKSEEYEYEDLMDRMSKLAKQLRGDKERVLQLRDVLQMQVKIALEAGEFRHCREPCSAFVRTLSSPLSMQGRNINMVGQWFVSILLKGKSGNSRGFSAMLEVAQEMRSFPAGATEDPWVHESIQAFRYVVGHNWSGFFKRTMENCQKSPLSQILEGFIAFMRAKALVTLTVGNVVEEKLAVRSLPLTNLLSYLAWDSSEDIEASVEEVKEFVASLEYPFEFGQNDKGAECIRWRGVFDEGLSLSEDIDVREEMLYKWNKVRVLEEE